MPYRHRLADPEPPHLRRILVDGWDHRVRLPCMRTRWLPTASRQSIAEMRRHARRNGYRNQHLHGLGKLWPYPGRCRPGVGTLEDIAALGCGHTLGEDSHRHWAGGGRTGLQTWHHMRGGEVALDLDAVQRMHRAYRHKRKGRW